MLLIVPMFVEAAEVSTAGVPPRPDGPAEDGPAEGPAAEDGGCDPAVDAFRGRPVR
jgi:hypothetical protein